MQIKIKHRYTNAVLFECDAPEDMESGLHMRHALEKATQARACLARANLASAYLARANLARANLAGAYLAGANLDGANLAGANLAGAYLARANLDGANLAGANLDGANLAGAYLARANLARANLDGANLAGANLAGAYLDGNANLIGERPVFQIGPIGSRSDFFTVYITDQGLWFDAGCQRQITREAFEARLAKTHVDNKHAKEYRAALALIDVHAEIWTPAKEGES